MRITRSSRSGRTNSGLARVSRFVTGRLGISPKPFFSIPDRIRTCNLSLRRAAPYPVELRGRTARFIRSFYAPSAEEQGIVAAQARCQTKIEMSGLPQIEMSSLIRSRRSPVYRRNNHRPDVYEPRRARCPPGHPAGRGRQPDPGGGRTPVAAEHPPDPPPPGPPRRAGHQAVVHRRRRPSHRRRAAPRRRKVLAAYRRDDPDFGPTLPARSWPSRVGPSRPRR